MQPTVVGPTAGILPWGNGFRDFGEQGGGTSSCTPQVAGAMAILMTEYPKADNRMLRNALRAGARFPESKPGPWDPYYGFGVLQVANALSQMRRIKGHPYYALFP